MFSLPSEMADRGGIVLRAPIADEAVLSIRKNLGGRPGGMKVV